MSEEKKAVVIGGGIAGVQAASSISGMAVTLVSNEPYLPYYRMRIEEVLGGKEPEALYIHPQSWYEEKCIEYISGSVVAISKGFVSLSDGREIPYDKLLIATGSAARSLNLPGGRKQGCVLRTMTDAISLKTCLKDAKSFTVIGGGLLGLEAACSVADDFNIPVSVIETAPYILPRQLDEESAKLLQAKLQERGVNVIVSGETESADDSYVYLKDGRKIASDVLCFSVGVNPGKELAEKAGIKTNRGIIIDSHMQTSMENVYAAGDAAELDGRTFGLAMHAREMGSAAAKAMMGESVEYVPSEPSSLLKIAGIDVVSLGALEGVKKVETDGDKRRTFFVQNGILRGAVLINDKVSMMKVKSLIGKEF